MISKRAKKGYAYNYSPVPKEEGILTDVDRNLGTAKRNVRGNVITQPGDIDVFGDLIKSRTFRKGLEKVQKKRKVTMYT